MKQKRTYSTTYKIYRRLRFLRYKKRIIKKRIKEQIKKEKRERRLQEQEAKRKLKLQKELERKQERLRRRREKEELALEREQLQMLPQEEESKPAFVLKKTAVNKEEEEKEQLEYKKRLEEQRRIERENIRKQKEKEKKLKQFNRKRRRRLLKVFVKRSLLHFWIGLRSLTPVKVKDAIKRMFGVPEDREKKRNYYAIMLNSLSMFLLSYFLIFILGQLIRILVSMNFDYKLILFYNKLYFDISVDAWTMDAVKILFSIIPLTGILLSAIFILLYSMYSEKGTLIRLFYLWGAVHGVNAMFGALFFGTLLEQGFGWVISYMYYMDTGKMVYSFIGLFALVALGSLLAKSFYSSAQHYFGYIDAKNKKYFVNSQIVAPMIIGTIIIILMKIPSDFYFETIDEMWFDILKSMGVFIVLIPMIGMIKSFGPMYFADMDEEPRITIEKKLFLATFGLIIFLRLALHAGIHIG